MYMCASAKVYNCASRQKYASIQTLVLPKGEPCSVKLVFIKTSWPIWFLKKYWVWDGSLWIFKGVVAYYQAAIRWKYTPLEGVKPMLTLSTGGLGHIMMVSDFQIQRRRHSVSFLTLKLRRSFPHKNRRKGLVHTPFSLNSLSKPIILFWFFRVLILIVMSSNPKVESLKL